METIIIFLGFLAALVVAALILGPVQVSARESRREEEQKAERHLVGRD